MADRPAGSFAQAPMGSMRLKIDITAKSGKPCRGCGKKGVAAIARASARTPALADFAEELRTRYGATEPGTPNEKGPRTLGGALVPMTRRG